MSTRNASATTTNAAVPSPADAPPSPSALQMRVATPSPSDEEMVLEMIQAFYAEEQIVFVEERARRAVRQLTRQPECGAVLLFTLPKPAGGCGCGGNGDGGEPCCDTEVIAGYAVATIGFTLEHGGRLVLLDEFYLRRFTRGRGCGQQALSLVKNWARERGVEALRLEVHHHNLRAKAIYEKAGFQNDHRDLMTFWL
ncbi:GNAT family N-acetyltransferase [Geminisphaera colitermitum]|uniref:GNAT family N-acetyltransferase n=1 Tax=Geminisphaera colitermitum TaxID=1148786 RepID=UPI000158CD4A|nr:GNAT family N-acetyltransferase [Geminisphaera colitermitum]